MDFLGHHAQADLSMGDLSGLPVLQDQEKPQLKVHPYKKDGAQYFSVVSPLPGNTPPPLDAADAGANKEFKIIENFLRQNNVTISSDMPMPKSKRVSSRGNSRLSEGLQSESQQLAPQTLNTILQTSNGNTLDSQKMNLFQTQIDALHSTVSMIVQRLDAVAANVRTSNGMFDTEQLSIHRSESLIKEVKTSLEAKLIQNSQKLLAKIEKHDLKIEELESELRGLQGGRLAEQRSLETSFINTISNVSIPRDAQQSASHHRTLSKTRNKSRQELTSAQHNYSVTSLKNKAGLEDAVKQVIAQLSLVDK